jgi:tRNA G37 N-methylase TrmD
MVWLKADRRLLKPSNRKSKIKNQKSAVLRFDIITIFPDFFRGVFDFGILRRARAVGLVEVAAHDLRAWTHDRHKVVDDRPFGGEPAAVVLIDAVTRLLPGALGSETSAVNESFSEGLLDFPNYTRPVEFRGRRVPEVLLSGHHAGVARWRRRAALRKTRRNRPDLFARLALGEEERAAAEGEEGE